MCIYILKQQYDIININALFLLLKELKYFSINEIIKSISNKQK